MAVRAVRLSADSVRAAELIENEMAELKTKIEAAEYGGDASATAELRGLDRARSLLMKAAVEVSQEASQ
jgi:hypothetical protein